MTARPSCFSPTAPSGSSPRAPMCFKEAAMLEFREIGPAQLPGHPQAVHHREPEVLCGHQRLLPVPGLCPAGVCALGPLRRGHPRGLYHVRPGRGGYGVLDLPLMIDQRHQSKGYGRQAWPWCWSASAKTSAPQGVPQLQPRQRLGPGPVRERGLPPRRPHGPRGDCLSAGVGTVTPYL